MAQRPYLSFNPSGGGSSGHALRPFGSMHDSPTYFSFLKFLSRFGNARTQGQYPWFFFGYKKRIGILCALVVPWPCSDKLDVTASLVLSLCGLPLQTGRRL